MASKSRGKVSLSDEDRQYVSESLKNARGRGAAIAAESEGALFEALERFGLSSDRVKKLRGSLEKMDVRESVDKAQDYLAEQIENARDYARENPGKVIGGAAGVLVGASLLAYALSRAGAGSPRKRPSGRKASSAKSSSAKKSSSSKKRSR